MAGKFLRVPIKPSRHGQMLLHAGPPTFMSRALLKLSASLYYGVGISAIYCRREASASHAYISHA